MATTTSDSSTILGVVVLARHGDREGFYQDPNTYTPSDTHITALGNQQAYLLGTTLRQTYFTAGSPNHIGGLDATTLARTDRVRVRADAGGEGGVVLGSATAMLQGLFPPSTQYNAVLANGSTVVGPLGGYQTFPIESVEPANDISLEGFVDCPAFGMEIQEWYEYSEELAEKDKENAALFDALKPYVNGRAVSMKHMWNVFDYMNVQSIHNASYAASLPDGYLAQARHLANWLQYHTFSSRHLDGIGNIAGRTILPTLLDGFAEIADSEKQLRFLYQAISYKPFISLFNMTGAAEAHPELAGIVNYSAAMAIEVRRPAPGAEPVLRLKFKNGTEEADFKTYSFMGSQNDVPLSTFVDRLSTASIGGFPEWCSECQNSEHPQCAALTAAMYKGQALAAEYLIEPPSVSPLGAGFIGAGVALAFALSMFAVLAFLGFLTIGKSKRFETKRKPSLSGSETSLSTKV